MFLISSFGVQVRGVATPNVLVGVLVFFGGICQFISGIMEFISGNTVSLSDLRNPLALTLSSVRCDVSAFLPLVPSHEFSTHNTPDNWLTSGSSVFPSYGAFNLSYAMIYLPGSGILAAYTDPATGELNAQFPTALAMYLWAWFILTVIFTIAAMRSSWVLFLDLFFLDIVLLLLACGYMLNESRLETAGSALEYVVAILSCKFPPHLTSNFADRRSDWAGCAGLFANGITPLNIPVFPMYKGD